MSNIENIENVKQNKNPKKNNILLRLVGALIIIILIAFDQWTKIMAVNNLMDKGPVVIIDGVFELFYVENTGAAFGMLAGGVDFFVVVTCILVPAMLYLITKIDDVIIKYGNKVNVKGYFALKVDLGFLIAGALGNFIDRIVSGYVVDMFYFKLIDFPVFNVADIYVTLATIVLIIVLFFVLNERELDYILYSKKKWDMITEKEYDDEIKKNKKINKNKTTETDNIVEADDVKVSDDNEEITEE